MKKIRNNNNDVTGVITRTFRVDFAPSGDRVLPNYVVDNFNNLWTSLVRALAATTEKEHNARLTKALTAMLQVASPLLEDPKARRLDRDVGTIALRADPKGGCCTRALVEIGIDVPHVEAASYEDLKGWANQFSIVFVLADIGMLSARNPDSSLIVITPDDYDYIPKRVVGLNVSKQLTHCVYAVDLGTDAIEALMGMELNSLLSTDRANVFRPFEVAVEGTQGVLDNNPDSITIGLGYGSDARGEYFRAALSGLELRAQHFMWVLHSCLEIPDENATFMNLDVKDSLSRALPSGHNATGNPSVEGEEFLGFVRELCARLPTRIERNDLEKYYNEGVSLNAICLAADDEQTSAKTDRKRARQLKRRAALEEAKAKVKEEYGLSTVTNRQAEFEILMNNFALQNSENKKAIEELKAQLKNVRNQGFKANNFLASEIAMPSSGLMSSLLAKMEGLQIPANTPSDAVKLVEDVVSGARLAPKRIGDDSAVMRVTSSGILSLDGVLTAGNAIYVISPVFSAYKGALVFQMTPTGTDPTVIGYISPDRDVEEFTNYVCPLYANLSVSAPLVIGGTSTIVAQMTVESGLTRVCPLQAIPGKLAQIAVGKHAEHNVMGAETHHVADLTYDVPVEKLGRFSSSDMQNTNLVRIPNAASQQTVGQLMSTTYGTVKFEAGTPVDSTAAVAAGYVSGIVSGVNIGTSLFTLWELKNSTDYLRAMWFGHMSGHFHLKAAFDLGTTRIQSFLRITYSDGSTIDVGETLFPSNLNDIVTVSGFFTTRGMTAVEAKTGLYIVNIQWMADMLIAAAATISQPSLTIHFEDVSSQTEYLAHVITGAVEQAKVNVQLTCDVEVQPDSTTVAGKYVDITNDMAVSANHLGELCHVLKYSGRTSYSGDFKASSFFDGLKKIGRFVWRNGGKQMAMGGLGGVAGGLATKALPAAINAVSNITSGGSKTKKQPARVPQPAPPPPGQPDALGAYNMPAPYPPGYYGYRAVTFGANERQQATTGLVFPGTRDSEVKYFPVRYGVPNGPAFTRLITRSTLGAVGEGNAKWEGESADLAFFLAALKAEKWPVVGIQEAPLLCSGDIEHVRYFGNSVTFDIVPVKDTELKFSDSPYPYNFWVSPDGFHFGDELFDSFPIKEIFGPTVDGTTEKLPDTGLPIWRVSIRR